MAGRKNKYETNVAPHLDMIRKKVDEGVTEKAIAEALGITEQSLNNYKKKYTELAAALKPDGIKGAERLQELINAGIMAACGYFKEIETVQVVFDRDGNPKKQKTVVKQWFPPNAALQQFYVRNFGKQYGFTSDPLEYELKKQRAEMDAEAEKLKNWHIEEI